MSRFPASGRWLRKWRREQDSNLHALSDGGFQDLKAALNLILRL
jgi:hypothetical protein